MFILLLLLAFSEVKASPTTLSLVLDKLSDDKDNSTLSSHANPPRDDDDPSCKGGSTGMVFLGLALALTADTVFYMCCCYYACGTAVKIETQTLEEKCGLDNYLGWMYLCTHKNRFNPRDMSFCCGVLIYFVLLFVSGALLPVGVVYFPPCDDSDTGSITIYILMIVLGLIAFIVGLLGLCPCLQVGRGYPGNITVRMLSSHAPLAQPGGRVLYVVEDRDEIIHHSYPYLKLPVLCSQVLLHLGAALVIAAIFGFITTSWVADNFNVRDRDEEALDKLSVGTSVCATFVQILVVVLYIGGCLNLFSCCCPAPTRNASAVDEHAPLVPPHRGPPPRRGRYSPTPHRYEEHPPPPYNRPRPPYENPPDFLPAGTNTASYTTNASYTTTTQQQQQQPQTEQLPTSYPAAPPPSYPSEEETRNTATSSTSTPSYASTDVKE